ncbi:MAG: N-acetylmuramic acid 6-phosphate etherase [Rhodothermales bacterium]|jgi:N-acetylmuramic acid 6-phosphate etherase
MSAPKPAMILAIDGGGSNSRAVLVDDSRAVIHRDHAGPCNVRILSPDELRADWQALADRLPAPPDAVGAFLAGCDSDADRRVIVETAQQIWPNCQVLADSDVSAAHAGAFALRDGILLLSGTGAGVFGHRNSKRCAIGGHGHVAGDGGSAYWIGQQLLRLAMRDDDRGDRQSPLIAHILRQLCLNVVSDLSLWSMHAPKQEIAALAPIAFAHARRTRVSAMLDDAADWLAEGVCIAAKRLRWSAPTVAVAGSVLTHNPAFVRRIGKRLRAALPGARTVQTQHEPVMGAAMLTRAHFYGVRTPLATGPAPSISTRQLSNALTEQRNPRARHLEKQSIPELVQIMNSEDARIAAAVADASPEIIATIELAAARLAAGGRLLYIGAGTSGRLGVLDAVECPPTFQSDPEQVQGIMAGGASALHRAVESCEDSESAGSAAILARGVNASDMLIGIAASGSTPYVLAALRTAADAGAATALLTCNPAAEFALPAPFVRIAIATGPEIIAGSTRLKAGTATKLVLNMITTISMIRLGKVVDNMMIDLNPSCAKLRDRQTRILCELRNINAESARDQLKANGWNLRAALV